MKRGEGKCEGEGESDRERKGGRVRERRVNGWGEKGKERGRNGREDAKRGETKKRGESATE